MTITWTFWLGGQWHILSGRRTMCGRTMPKNRRGFTATSIGVLSQCKNCVRAVER